MDSSSVRRFEVPTRNAMLAVYEARPPQGIREQATAFFVPGVVIAKEDFVDLVQPLTEAGYRICAYDHRGTGESSSRPRVEDHTMATFADDLRTVAHAMSAGPGPVHLVGHGLGGFVARAATLAAPYEVRSLTLLDSGPSGRSFRFVDLLELAGRDGGLPTSSETTAAFWGRITDRLAGHDVLPEHLTRLEGWVFAADPEVRAGLSWAYLTEPDRTDELRATAVPTLVIPGTDDLAWPASLQTEMADRLGAWEVVLPRTGSLPYGVDPAQLASALIDLWTSLDDSDPAVATDPSHGSTRSPRPGAWDNREQPLA